MRVVGNASNLKLYTEDLIIDKLLDKIFRDKNITLIMMKSII